MTTTRKPRVEERTSTGAPWCAGGGAPAQKSSPTVNVRHQSCSRPGGGGASAGKSASRQTGSSGASARSSAPSSPSLSPSSNTTDAFCAAAAKARDEIWCPTSWCV